MKIRRIVKGIIAGLAGLITYDWLYRFLFPLHQQNPSQFTLEEGRPTSLKLDFIREDHYGQDMEEVFPMIGSVQISSLLAIEGQNIYYDFYLLDRLFPTIVILHGFNEFKEKYHEMVYYFIQWNYNVLVYDQRGHGFSKANDNDRVVDIDNFQTYQDDLEKLLIHVKEVYQLNDNLLLYGHSMGGTIALGYVLEHPQQISKLILSSPMLNIDTSPLSRPMAHLLSSGANLINIEGFRIPFQAAKGIGIHSYYTPNPGLSRSIARNRYTYELNKTLHKNPTQGGSLRWIRAGLMFLRNLLNQEILEKTEIPILAFFSETDRIVRNDGLFHVAHYLPNIILISVEEAGHEIYQERDEILEPYLQIIGKFLNES